MPNKKPSRKPKNHAATPAPSFVAPDLDRFRAYCATPPEDQESRAAMRVTDDEVQALHAAGWEQPRLRPLVLDVLCFRRADELVSRYPCPEGIPLAVWVQSLRDVLRSVKHHPLTRGDSRGVEIEYGYALPFARILSRRIQHPSGDTDYELEIAFQTDAFPLDLRTKSPAWKERFVSAAILTCQWHPANEEAKRLNFLPPQGERYRVILTAGDQREEFDQPLAVAFGPLVGLAAQGHRLEDGISKDPHGRVRQRQVETQEALLGLWKAVREFPGDEVRHPSGYLKRQVAWHMGNAFDAASTTDKKSVEQLEGDNRGWWDDETASAMGHPSRTDRVLKQKVDSAGGSYDAPPPGTSDGGLTPQETIPDPAGPPPSKPDRAAITQGLLLQGALGAVSKGADRRILEMVASGYSEQEIAQALGRSQPAIAQRLKKLRKNPKLRDLFGR